ncbi:unnamed protein product [Pelagomonas calceolata]|uniref:Uncharacterized protein n=1 Tax=Pelagomonas calceolata TaxID=35677 RepID=A0A8J2SZM0_9STRA|nr:unnamed protein product [Pelagomonas calceolata]
MVKKQGSKTTGGTPPKKKFGKKAAPDTYEADKKVIETFCKRRENRGLGQKDLARRACEKLGFNAMSFSAVEGYIKNAKLVSAAAKAANKKAKMPAHAKIDLKTVTVKEMVKEEDGYAVPTYPLTLTSDSSTNKHPNSAPLRGEPVRIVGEGKAAVDDALEKAFDRNRVILSYVGDHGAEFAALLEDLEESDPERYERLVAIKEKYDDVPSFRFETGRHASGIPGVHRMKRKGQPDRLVIIIKGSPFEGDSEDDTPEGRKIIEAKVAGSYSRTLERAPVLAKAEEALQNGATEESLVAESDLSLVPGAEPGAARASRGRATERAPRASAPRKRAASAPAPTTKRPKRDEMDRLAQLALRRVHAAAAAARRKGVAIAFTDETMRAFERLCTASSKKTPPTDRPTVESYKDVIQPLQEALDELWDALDIDSESVMLWGPCPPTECLGQAPETKPMMGTAWNAVMAGGWAGGVNDASEHDSFVAALDGHCRDRGLLKHFLERRYGAVLTPYQYAELAPAWCVDVAIDFNDREMSVPVLEGVFLRPKALANRWRHGMRRSEWVRYMGAGRVDAIVARYSAATNLLRADEHAGFA